MTRKIPRKILGVSSIKWDSKRVECMHPAIDVDDIMDINDPNYPANNNLSEKLVAISCDDPRLLPMTEQIKMLGAKIKEFRNKYLK